MEIGDLLSSLGEDDVKKLKEMAGDMKKEVEAKDARLQEEGFRNY